MPLLVKILNDFTKINKLNSLQFLINVLKQKLQNINITLFLFNKICKVTVQ